MLPEATYCYKTSANSLSGSLSYPWRRFWLLHLFPHGLSQINNFASYVFGGRHSQFSFSIDKREMSTIFLGWL